MIFPHANKSWHWEVCEMCKSVETAAATLNFLLAMFHSLITLLKVFFIYDTRQVVSKCFCAFWVMLSDLSEEKNTCCPVIIKSSVKCQVTQTNNAVKRRLHLVWRKRLGSIPVRESTMRMSFSSSRSFQLSSVCCNRKSSTAETEASSQTRKQRGFRNSTGSSRDVKHGCSPNAHRYKHTHAHFQCLEPYRGENWQLNPVAPDEPYFHTCSA